MEHQKSNIYISIAVTFTLLSPMLTVAKNQLPLTYFEKGDTRESAYSSSEDRAVHKAVGVNMGCSAVFISPHLAFSAHHCDRAREIWLDEIDKMQFLKLPIAQTIVSRNYSDNGSHLQEDFALFYLSSPAPTWVNVLNIASPEEVKIGMEARAIGYPGDRLNSLIRTKDNCTIKNLYADSILIDCAIAPGNSGGPLIVKVLLANGQHEWKIAGVGSTIVKDYRGGPYFDQVAPRFTNITFFGKRIAQTLEKAGIPVPKTLKRDSLAAQCIDRLVQQNWRAIPDPATKACMNVMSMSGIDCLELGWLTGKGWNPWALTALSHCRSGYAHEVTKYLVETFSHTVWTIELTAKIQNQKQRNCMVTVLNKIYEGESVSENAMPRCVGDK